MISISKNKKMLNDQSIIDLINKGMYEPNPQKIEKFMNKINSVNGEFFIAFNNEIPVGFMAVFEEQKNHFIIQLIYIESDYRKSGIGRMLINELKKENGSFIIEAETSNDAVGFYHANGFRINSLGEKYPGIIRYQCIYSI
jgi:ribosomal protein S18 acetylase RimI-like enzyme